MRSGFEFVRDEGGIADVTTSDEVGELLTDVAEEAADMVRRYGPKGDDFFDYDQSVRAVPATGGGKDIEAGVAVDSPGWHLPEYGTARYPPRAPLRKGVAAVVDFKEGDG